MKFVNDIPNLPKEEIEEFESLVKDVELEKQRQDQLGIKETKPVEEPKPKTTNLTKEDWVEKTVGTLVNLRKDPDTKSTPLTTIRGGEIIKVSSSFSHPSFEKVMYKNREGYVKKEYVRSI